MQGKTTIANDFKEKCEAQVHNQPPPYLYSFLKDKLVDIDRTANEQDLPYIQVMLRLKTTHIHLMRQPQFSPKSPKKSTLFKKIKQLLQCLNKVLLTTLTLTSLKLTNVPLRIRQLKQLFQGIKQSKSLCELVLSYCSLTDQHILHIKQSLYHNQSLISLDLSHNSLKQAGGMLGKLLSQHSRRRTQIVWMNEIRGEKVGDLTRMGLCQLNLSYNQIESINDLIGFLKGDTWTRCINLRHNKLNADAVLQFVLLMKENQSLIYLDLRDNEGFIKEYSRYIFRRLVQNMEAMKKEKVKVNIKSGKKKNISSEKEINQNQYIQESQRINSTGKEIRRILSKYKCMKCRELMIKCLKLEKVNLDLSVQNSKLRHLLGINYVEKQKGESNDELIQRMEIMMMELTKIMETVEEQTYTNLTSPLQNNYNSLQNTIPLYKESGLDILSREINEAVQQLEEQQQYETNNQYIGEQ